MRGKDTRLPKNSVYNGLLDFYSKVVVLFYVLGSVNIMETAL